MAIRFADKDTNTLCINQQGVIVDPVYDTNFVSHGYMRAKNGTIGNFSLSCDIK